MKRQRALTIAGYYGFGNLGDEALRRVLVEALERAGFSPLFVLVRHPNRPGEVDRADPLALFRSIRRSSALVFGGGGLLQNRTSNRSLWYYLSLVLLARVARRPVFLLGQGIGPIQGRLPRVATRFALRRVRYIGCRDKGGLAFVQSLGLSGSLDGDLLFLLSPLEEAGLHSRRTPPRVVLALRGTEEAARGLVGEYAGLLRGLQARTDASFALLVSHPEEDLPFARALKDSTGVSCQIVTPRSVEEATEELLSGDLLIGSRLHALEIGLRAGTPLLALSEDPKIAHFVQEAKTLAEVEIPLSSSLSLEVVLRALESAPAREALLAAYRALHERTTRALAAAVDALGGSAGGDL